jgi:hypothetical protein
MAQHRRSRGPFDDLDDPADSMLTVHDEVIEGLLDRASREWGKPSGAANRLGQALSAVAL